MKRLMLAVLTLLFALSLAASSGCAKVRSVARPAAGETRPVKVTMVVQGIVPELTKAFRKGDKVKVAESNALIGTIVSVETTQTETTVGTADGRLVVQRSPISDDVTLVIDGTVQVLEDGYSFSNNRIWIGTNTGFTTPVTTFKGLVTEIETKG